MTALENGAIASEDAAAALAELGERPAVVTIDLHRGHLDPAVATLPLPADAAAALVERTVPLLDEYRALGIPVIHVRYRIVNPPLRAKGLQASY